MKKRMNRRAFLRMAGGAAAGAALAACQPQTVVVEKEVLKEVEKVVTQVVKETVKETVIVEGTPKVIEKEVEKLVTVAPVEMEPVTITWMNWWGAHREVLMLEIIARFQEEFPHITVENQVQPWDNREQRAATAIASQDPPSLIMVPRVESQKFAYEGLIIPIDPYIEAKGYDVYDIFVESDINNCRWEDQFWSYPLPSGGVDSSFWLYNKNMMRDAGLDPEKPPTTWQEVEQVIEATTKIVDGDLETCGLTGVGSGNFPKWLYCNDGQYYGDDSKQLLFNQEEGVQTLEWMIGLIDKMGGIDAYNAYTQVGTDALEADFKFYHDTLCMFAPSLATSRPPPPSSMRTRSDGASRWCRTTATTPKPRPRACPALPFPGTRSSPRAWSKRSRTRPTSGSSTLPCAAPAAAGSSLSRPVPPRSRRATRTRTTMLPIPTGT
jgi:ABC-type glycerol-3-phosphate transport system substrate-binding protein